MTAPTAAPPQRSLSKPQSVQTRLREDRDESSGHIVTAIIGMARGFKLKVIAEGVETKKQLDALRKQGCDEVRGFLFSPASPPGEFETLLRQWNQVIRDADKHPSNRSHLG